jgi:hypothetical protein
MCHLTPPLDMAVPELVDTTTATGLGAGDGAGSLWV